jgi:hypothetical protein
MEMVNVKTGDRERPHLRLGQGRVPGGQQGRQDELVAAPTLCVSMLCLARRSTNGKCDAR